MAEIDAQVAELQAVRAELARRDRGGTRPPPATADRDQQVV